MCFIGWAPFLISYNAPINFLKSKAEFTFLHLQKTNTLPINYYRSWKKENQKIFNIQTKMFKYFYFHSYININVCQISNLSVSYFVLGAIIRGWAQCSFKLVNTTINYLSYAQITFNFPLISGIFVNSLSHFMYPHLWSPC